MIIVSNATPLIGLAKIKHLDLLKVLFDTIVVPQAVYDEVVTHARNRPGAEAIREADWIETKVPADRSKVAYLRIDLDAGEAETLVLAEELAADWVLLDEQKARLAASMIGIRTVGTVGLLLLAKQAGKIGSVRPLLDQLRVEKFHLSDKVYQAVLEQAGE